MRLRDDVGEKGRKKKIRADVGDQEKQG